MKLALFRGGDGARAEAAPRRLRGPPGPGPRPARPDRPGERGHEGARRGREAGAAELIALVGPSGCGKTTLLRAVAGLADPLAGEVLLGGKPAAEIGWPRFRRRLVYVAQRAALIDGTVLQNLAIAFTFSVARGERLDEARARDLLEALAVGDVLEQQARTLSEGQKQRVALARALLRMRELGYGCGISGAVTVVQRTNADLRLNPHLHSVVLDGVYVADEQGEPVFVPLPALDWMDVAELLQVVRVRLLRFFERRGVIEQAAGLTLLPDELCEREPALAQLAAASVSGLPPAGPERRDRPPRAITLRGEPGVRMTAPLAAAELGFSMHAATTADADDEPGREALVRYVLRPPVSQERLELLGDGLVRIALRRPFGDGTTAVDIDPLSLLCRLAAAVPPPYFNTVRYGGVLAPAAKWRSLVVPSPPPDTKQPKPITHRSAWRPCSELMKRCFAIEVEKCPSCGGRMKLRALVTKPASIRRLLRHLSEPTDAPPLAPARDPPSYCSPVLRRRTRRSSPPRQVEMFGLGP